MELHGFVQMRMEEEGCMRWANSNKGGGGERGSKGRAEEERMMEVERGCVYWKGRKLGFSLHSVSHNMYINNIYKK